MVAKDLAICKQGAYRRYAFEVAKDVYDDNHKLHALVVLSASFNDRDYDDRVAIKDLEERRRKSFESY